MFNLGKKAVGIDIADRTIEIVELKKSGHSAEVVSKKRVYLKPGIVEKGRVKDEDSLAKIIEKALKEAKPKAIAKEDIAFGLPERQVFTHIFSLSAHKRRERESLIKREIDNNIPIESERLVYVYQILNETKDKMNILAMAADRKVIYEWQNIFRKIGVKMEIFDTETLAAIRGLYDKKPVEPVCLIDIGAATTDVSIFHKDGLQHSYAINKAGDAIAKAIAKEFKIDIVEAENKKLELDLTAKNNKLNAIIKPILDLIMADVKKSIDYFTKQGGFKVDHVILLGGTSKIKGIHDYFAKGLGLEVRPAKSTILAKSAALEYVVAIGYALKKINDRFASDPVLRVIEKKTPESVKSKQKIESVPLDKEAEAKEKLESAIQETALSTARQVKSDMTKEMRRQTIVLLVVIAIGAGLIGLAYWYRANEKVKQANEVQTQISEFKHVQTINLDLLIATLADEYTKDRVKGSLFDDSITEAADYNEAIQLSQVKMEAGLKAGDKLYPTPLNPDELAALTNPPYIVSWLTYNEENLNTLAINAINKLNTEKVNYLLDSISVGSVTATENPNLFNLGVNVNISTDKLIKTK